jgi:hypothetical protein
MMYGVAADVDMPRQLFNLAPGLRGPTALQPNIAASPAINPAVYLGQQEANVWSPEQYAIPVQFEAEAPQSSFFDTATVFLCAMAGAATGFAATMLSRDQRAAEPKLAMLGVGGQAGPISGAPPQTQSYSGGVMPSRGGPMPDSTILVQGGSLRTWSYRSPAVEQVQVVLSTEGRPLDADIELWHGPDNTPVKMRVYVENGQLRPFSAVIETPRGPNTVAIRNIGQIEFPIAANVIAEDVDLPSPETQSSGMTIQGGALRTYPFDPTVDSVEVLIKTDGRPLNARIELLQGPNNNKQVIELYTEDGCDRPFFCILETPGSGNGVRIVNTSPVEFPMACAVVPHSINQSMGSGAVLGGDVVIGGDVGW